MSEAMTVDELIGILRSVQAIPEVCEPPPEMINGVTVIQPEMHEHRRQGDPVWTTAGWSDEVPTRWHKPQRSKRGVTWRYPWKRMHIGEGFYIPDDVQVHSVLPLGKRWNIDWSYDCEFVLRTNRCGHHYIQRVK